MAHVYDTGLPRAQRTLLRDAILNRLGALRRNAGLYAGTIAGIPSPLGNQDVKAVLESSQGQGTAIFVALGRKSYTPTGLSGHRDQYMGELEVFVYVMSDNERRPLLHRVSGDVASTLNSQADPGLETMLEHIEELLIGHQITDASQTIYQLEPVDEAELAHGDEMTLWVQQYSVKVQRDLRRDKGVTDTLTSVDTLTNVDGADAVNPIARTLTDIPS